jgi:hypothetical protein
VPWAGNESFVWVARLAGGSKENFWEVPRTFDLQEMAPNLASGSNIHDGTRTLRRRVFGGISKQQVTRLMQRAT